MPWIAHCIHLLHAKHAFKFDKIGEKLTETELATVTKDCLDPEDDEGMVQYVRKYPTPRTHTTYF